MRKINDPYTAEQLQVIDRYRLERMARRYQEDTSKIITDAPTSITMWLPRFSIPLVKADENDYEIGRVYMTDEVGTRGLRKLAFEYVKEVANA